MFFLITHLLLCAATAIALIKTENTGYRLVDASFFQARSREPKK
jgi:hypothetical protein